jgi:hypothetical protein
VGRLVTFIALSTLLAACQSTTTPVATPSPSPSPHTAVTAAVLQPGEVPPGLTQCPGSGPIAGYLLKLEGTDHPALASRMTERWQELQAKGAVDAAISLFTADPAACNAELGVTSNIKAAASFVAVFADEGQAERAWGSGVLGFVPPAPGEVAAGLVRGTGTGLGPTAWTYDRPSVRLACWRRSVLVSLVVLTNLDPTAFKSVTAAIDARLN